ncbi:PE-PPE domain-containing protein [Mycobacterium sp. NS-7484]|uniref:PE-PPE domain-containing protein n=1 Tax=Mycobacterium sp. NS-7484 TaxID=1834161 RepID=UPI00096D4C91|nr:PE-PPE domain-containing protein [Mycobacterium sp. NS-7484]OMB96182.1 PE-PPE domain-containing protein [Mycobacterium sp. NS-7484]
MANHRRKKATKAAVIGTAIAATVGVGLTPTVANAVSSETYFVGFPDWLPIGDGNKIEANPNAIYQAILDAKDKDPLVGWGTGGVQLDPKWVQWYNPNLDPTKIFDPTKDQYYTPESDNSAYADAFGAKKAELLAADKATILAQQTIQYTVDIKNMPEFKDVPSWAWELIPADIRYQTINVPNPFFNNPDALDTVLAGGTYNATYRISVPIKVKLGFLKFERTITADVPYKVDLAKLNLTTKDYNQLAHDYVVNELGIPEKNPGYWTTNTYGQWVSPTDQLSALGNLDLSALAGLANGDGDFGDLLGSLSSLSPQQVAYFLSGDLGFLAPLVNWTAYIQNVNLIAYGDGAIATGEAYRQFIEAVQNGEIQAGEPKTDGMYIVINPDGQNVIRLVNQNDGSILDYPLPDDLEFPEAPEGGPSYIETPGGVIDITLMTMALLRNPGRPNGGLYARFAPIYQELTGINPVSPERTDVLYGLPPDTIAKLVNGDVSGVELSDVGDLLVMLNDANGKPMVITIKADATWEYDLLSDAPVTANPIAWANSLASSMLVLTYGNELLGLATGQEGSGVGVVAYTVPVGEYDAGSFYATLTTESLPLLAPARLVAGLFSAATGENVNTPVADALEPLLKLLVNTSYTDVERNEDGTWTRTLDQMHVPTLFGTQTLTREQSALLAGDIIAELGRGVGSEYTDIVQRVTTRVVNFLEDNDIEVPDEVKVAAAKFATEPGEAIRTVSRQIGDNVSKVLTGIEAKLPDAPAAPTQQQLAAGQRETGKVLRAVKDEVDETTTQINEAADEFASSKVGVALKSAGNKVEADVTKRVTKTQKSLTHAQERADKVNAKLKQGDLKGAAKQVGENVKNRVDRLKKDVNNGVSKLTGKDKDKDKDNSDS